MGIVFNSIVHKDSRSYSLHQPFVVVIRLLSIFEKSKWMKELSVGQ